MDACEETAFGRMQRERDAATREAADLRAAVEAVREACEHEAAHGDWPAGSPVRAPFARNILALLPPTPAEIAATALRPPARRTFDELVQAVPPLVDGAMVSDEDPAPDRGTKEEENE